MNCKLINNLDFAGKLNITEAVTEAGKALIKAYKGHLFQNPTTCGLVNGFIREAQNFGYDTGVMVILNEVLKYVTDNNISWKLASACESVANNGSTYGYIAKLGIETVEKLLEMDESQVVGYIKSGALKRVQYVPEFRAVCKEVYNSSVNETVTTPTYTLETPFSFVVVSEGAQWFKVLGKTYKVSEGKATVEEYDDKVFNSVNALLPNFKMVDEALVYEWKPSYASDTYKFSISEKNGIEITKGKINEKFGDNAAWMQWADTYSRSIYMNEARQFLQIAANIGFIHENIENICLVDSAKVLECNNGTVLAIVEGADNVQLNVARALGVGQSQTEYDYMVEALDDVRKASGVDLRGSFTDRINEDIKKADPESYKSIQEQLQASKDALMDARKEKIAQLAESFKNDPVKIALLNSIAKELAILSE